MKRRSFIKCLGCGAAMATVPTPELVPRVIGGLQNAYAFSPTRELAEVEARYYEKLPEGIVRCGLCPRRCRIADAQRGWCGVRGRRWGWSMSA